MRTIYVTGGRKDYAEGELADSRGHDLATATIRLGVSSSRTVQPSSWYAPSVSAFPTAGTAVLSLLLDEAKAPPGQWFLWVDVVDNPTSQPVLASNDVIRTL